MIRSIIKKVRRRKMEQISNAKEIKGLYKELLSDGQIHSRKELFAYASGISGKRYTDGMLTGALRTLVTDDPDYECVDRARYRRKTPEDRAGKSNTILGAYAEIFSETLRKSKKITTNPFEILNMSQSEQEKMRLINQCLKNISDTFQRIQQ